MKRKTERIQELTAFRLKTRSLLKTLEVKPKDRPMEHASPTTFIGRYNIYIVISNVGVAFPLSVLPELVLPQTGNQDASATRAFLFSIKEIKFDVNHGESGQVTMSNFSFQFVSQ
jgi:hypothetical protein